MTQLIGHFFLRNENSKIITGILVGFLMLSGVVAVTSGSNTLASAQLERSVGSGEEQMAPAAEQPYESAQSPDAPS
ncbi:MAG TPA: hypothetical protein VE130_11435, partial [Nitrososphaeraceae archaeon]|nr:hypothetical protein [Nitrososphaeraceae archaeon]